MKFLKYNTAFLEKDCINTICNVEQPSDCYNLKNKYHFRRRAELNYDSE
jgi:hypothetical protein